MTRRVLVLALAAFGCVSASPPAGGGKEADLAPRAVEPAPPLRDEHAGAREVLLEAVNADRAANAAPPVAFDSVATAAAQAHAEAMASGGFFSHYGATGEAPYERYAAIGGLAHVRENVFLWRVSGGVTEDVERARASFDPRLVHAFLMASAGHRETILDPHRSHVGIGIARGDEGRTLIVVEDFLARHATIDAPRVAWRSPTVVSGRVHDRQARPLLIVLRPEPAVREWVARGEAPPEGPYADGSEAGGVLVPAWAMEWRRGDGSFRASLPLGGQRPGRWYGILYVAPAGTVERAVARGRASTEDGWPAAAFVLELL